MDRVEITKNLIDILKINGFDKEFARKVLIMVRDDEGRQQLTSYLHNNENITQSDVLIRIIEITRKADLVEAEFKKINPDIKI